MYGDINLYIFYSPKIRLISEELLNNLIELNKNNILRLLMQLYLKRIIFLIMKNILIIGFLILAFATVNAQDTKKLSRKEKKAIREAEQIEQTKTVLENKAYVFKATQVIPSGMRSKSLTSSYDARIENDTIFCYLPFFGQSHSAEYGSNRSPMDFTQPIENYEFKKTKKGYEIKFEASNKNDRLSFFFMIGETGSTSLSVNSTNRSTISYYGDIVDIKKKE